MATIPRDPDVLDDLHYAEGKEVPADEKLAFAIDGKNYSIDLTTDHADKFRKTFSPYITVAEEVRPSTGGSRRGGKSSSTSRPDRELTQKIRDWAAKQKIQLNEKGRIPNNVRDLYFDAYPAERPAS